MAKGSSTANYSARVLTKQAVTPDDAPADKIKLFADADGALNTVDEDGNVTAVGAAAGGSVFLFGGTFLTDQASLDIPSIPSNYRALKLSLMRLRTDNGGSSPSAMALRCNGDTDASHYFSQMLVSGGFGDPANFQNDGATASLVPLQGIGSLAGTNEQAHYEITIHAYADDTVARYCLFSGTYASGALAGTAIQRLDGAGVWDNATDAIDQLTVIGGNDIIAGFSWALYGLK